MSENKTEITIATSAIFKILIIALCLWLLYIIRPIVLILFVSLILAALIDPFADWFQRKKIHRGFAVILVYLVLIAIVTFAVWAIVPLVANEGQSLISNFGNIWNAVIEKLGAVGAFARNHNLIPESFDYSVLQPGVTGTVQGIFSTIGGVFVGVGSVILTFVMAFYMVVEEDAIKKLLRNIVPSKFQPFIAQLLGRARTKLGQWLRAQIILSAIIGAIVYVGMLIFGVEYAAVIGILAFALEFIPYVGPVLIGVFAIFLTFAQTGTFLQPFLVFIFFVIIQQLENNVLVPKIMQKNVGINPIISIIAMLVGAKLGGFVGVLLAIPVATFVTVFVDELVEKREA